MHCGSCVGTVACHLARVQMCRDQLLTRPATGSAAAADPEEAPQAHGAARALGPAGQPHVPALLLLGGEAAVWTVCCPGWQSRAGGCCSEAVAGQPHAPIVLCCLARLCSLSSISGSWMAEQQGGLQGGQAEHAPTVQGLDRTPFASWPLCRRSEGWCAKRSSALRAWRRCWACRPRQLALQPPPPCATLLPRCSSCSSRRRPPPLLPRLWVWRVLGTAASHLLWVRAALQPPRRQ